MRNPKEENSSTLITYLLNFYHSLSKRLSDDIDFAELLLRFFKLDSNSSLKILSATELLRLLSETEPFLDIDGLLLPFRGDVILEAARLSPLKLNELPRNDIAVDASDVRSPWKEIQIV